MKVLRIKDDGLIATSKAIQKKLKGSGTLVYKNGTGFADYINQIKTNADGSIPTYSGSNIITPSRGGTTLQTKGKYVKDNLNIMGDLDLKPENIRENVDIFGTKGTLKEWVDPKPTLTKDYTYIDTRKRYGVKFDGASTTGTRLFDAVGKTVEIAHSLDEVVRNDFDTDEWFKDITYPIVDGNYVTRFPMAYGKMDFANQEFVIANDSFDGTYDVLPFFKAPNGSILPYNDAGRFQLGPDYKSKPNVAWLASQTRSQFRSGVRGLGNQYSQWDIATITFIRVFFMIVLANRNSQQILPCNTSGSNRNTGDTLNAKSSIVQLGDYAGSFYGLENIVDGGYYFIDGVNCDAGGGKWYVCNDPSKYADDTINGYTAINNFGYPKASSSWITKMDIDPQAPYAGLVSQNSGGSDSTYYCDYHYRSTSGWRIMYTGGTWGLNTYRGLFSSLCNSDSSFAGTVGSRLVRRPY